MLKIVIIGGGIIGAMIAYELSKIPGFKITLLEENLPAFGSTGAALGVLMGGISRKGKGRDWRLRQASMARYETLIPELESLTGETIPFNRQGILSLRFIEETEEDRESWQSLIKIRHSQGFLLEMWEQETLAKNCPQVQNKNIIGAIYSPQDRQVNPTILTQTLIKGAAKNGVNLQFGVKVQNFMATNLEGSNLRHCTQIQTTVETFESDWLIIAAGLGSSFLTQTLAQPIDIRPVLGQALQIKLNETLVNQNFQPVITGNDIHIVSLGKGEYWLGATVEFPGKTGEVIAEPQLLEKLRQEAISFCPVLAKGEIIKSWIGKRPRPEGQPSPIIKELAGYNNILLATGHYRNGILLAPATAQLIQKKISLSQQNS